MIAIQTNGIGVSFDGVQVLRDISVSIRAGEIHGLIGENGAGKSTLGKIIGGYYQASTGSMTVYGTQTIRWNPPNALLHGVAMMHQELQLVPQLTVAENVFLGIEHETFGVLKRDEANRLDTLMLKCGFELNPHSVVADLSIADQQKIEILRALARNAKVIVMDEPTSSLSKDEVDQLHDTMRGLKEEDRTVIYVSHFLEDILRVTDQVTVLRDGIHVRTAPTSTETKSSLVSAMLGQGKSETKYPKKIFSKNPDKLLKVNNLKCTAGTIGATLTVDSGEIVGLLGLVGSGRSEIARAIIGADNALSGHVWISEKKYENRNVARSAKMGMVMVPEDRRKQGLIMSLSVRANMTLPYLYEFSNWEVVNMTAEKKRTRELVDWFQVRPSTLDGNILRYSGGNQQKVLFGKWLVGNPKIVILDEPSRGVDVGARERIHEAIVELASRGTGVLLISSEIEEVLGLAHRAYLIDRGNTVEEISPDKNDESSVLSALFHHQAPEMGIHTL